MRSPAMIAFLLTAGLLPAADVELGSRPLELAAKLEDGPLKQTLQACADGPFHKSEFVIGHRGAPLRYPEHTRESYLAAAKQGAGTVECDVTFTKDLELVCRHSQCDLATTTNILTTPLAAKCSQGFSPYDAATGKAASARCCTSDLTLAEFQSLCGRMDSSNAKASTVEEFLADAPVCSGKLMTHAESIALFQELDVHMTPEIKNPQAPMPFHGFSQQDLIRKILAEYRAAGVGPEDVRVQSFQLDDIYWLLEHEPAFGGRAVYLDGVRTADDLPASMARFPELAARGVKTLAPPLWALLTVDASGQRVASDYAKAAKAAGFDLIAWTLERSGDLSDGGGFYFQSTASVTHDESDYLEALDALAQQVGVLAVFSDWPATATFYANCMGLK
ncbi:MAG: glycerophosphodiester phosphodiesterase [Acidobacteria bacterium]|nr:glycerophosphodiester phosphodiesterase [Acidobacteriota bacterium]